MQKTYQKINLFKIFILQKSYNELIKLINKIVDHINFLDNNYLIEIDKKNDTLTELFNINEKINTIYNEYLTHPQIIDTKLMNILNIIDETDFEILYTKLNIDNMSPYKTEKEIIIKIINNIGAPNLLLLFDINKLKIDLSLINEINNIFIPLSFNTFSVNINNNIDYYWRIPTIYNAEDILQLTRELWIKNIDNIYYKIEGIFKTDILSLKIKNSQLLNKHLYEKKTAIINEIKNEHTNINLSFLKKFIKYDYIGNIYCMSLNDYINYILSSYRLYLQLIKTSFVNIMKSFINSDTQLFNLYYIIFLLLLGNDDNAEIATLIINLIKEKKINSINLYNLLHTNLPFLLQIKIKKSNVNINLELERIKMLTIENIDYKKQLLSIKNIPPYVKTLTLDKIEEMKLQNNEFYKQKTFVETILKYPWTTNEYLFEDLDNTNKISNYLNKIKVNLNNLTYGHNEAKNILLQIVAKWISKPESGGKPLGIVGPPGVGKTLLAKSISKALKIPFAEITLGGQNDGELLYGHGYTYSGSQPGMIIKKMVEMGKEKCILFFDELDKTASKHGNTNEIMSILIHLTDPNMNKSFQDRFFQGIDFPLDKVIMIFSYNDSKTIDPILLDRLTEITIKSYNLHDKIEIVKNYIIPEFQDNVNINLQFNDNIIEYIINNYTNEAGVRNIKRHIEKIYLTLNLEILTNEININNYKLTIDEVNRILLNPINEYTKIHLKPEIGIINGLYATTNGEGGIIPIQIFNNFTSSNFEIKYTGKQGDVMKESIQCSLTCAIDYIKKNLSKYSINDFNEYFLQHYKHGFHVHTPSTSISKDGPSAGCAFTCAFISRILNLPIKNDISMTGEIDLIGNITKIGGLDYKLIGAKKAGIKLVFIPKQNEDDFNEIIKKQPTLIDNNFKIKIISSLNDLINEIFY